MRKSLWVTPEKLSIGMGINPVGFPQAADGAKYVGITAGFFHGFHKQSTQTFPHIQSAIQSVKSMLSTVSTQLTIGLINLKERYL